MFSQSILAFIEDWLLCVTTAETEIISRCFVWCVSFFIDLCCLVEFGRQLEKLKAGHCRQINGVILTKK